MLESMVGACRKNLSTGLLAAREACADSQCLNVANLLWPFR